MSARNRDTLRAIIERESVAWAVAEIPAGRIDEINILNASFEGMNTAIRQLSVAPQFIAVDGNRFRTQLTLPYACIVKGDGKYADIAAASVLAKTHRDEYMMRLHEEYPQYGWDRNKGIPYARTPARHPPTRTYTLSPPELQPRERPARITDTPEVRPTRSSRTKVRTPQTSYAHNR